MQASGSDVSTAMVCKNYMVQWLILDCYYIISHFLYLHSFLVQAQPSEVTLFHYNQWPENGRPEIVPLLKLLFEVEKLQQRQEPHNAPIVMACK